jgi:hypothetical protein
VPAPAHHVPGILEPLDLVRGQAHLAAPRDALPLLDELRHGVALPRPERAAVVDLHVHAGLRQRERPDERRRVALRRGHLRMLQRVHLILLELDGFSHLIARLGIATGAAI